MSRLKFLQTGLSFQNPIKYHLFICAVITHYARRYMSSGMIHVQRSFLELPRVFNKFWLVESWFLDTWSNDSRYIIQWKKVNRKVQGVPQSQTAANPRHQEEETNDKNQHVQNKQTNARAAHRPAPSSPNEVITMRKGMTKHQDKEHGKTLKDEAPCSLNHKATQNKNNIGTTALERSVAKGGELEGLKYF